MKRINIPEMSDLFKDSVRRVGEEKSGSLYYFKACSMATMQIVF